MGNRAGTSGVPCYINSFSREVHSTDGTINITYSYTDFPGDITQDEPTSFFTRQLLFPVIVSVYQMLECTGLSIMPVSQLVLLDKDTQSEWYTLFKGLDEHEWCLLVLDVQNTYGLPFEVTVSNSDECMHFLVYQSYNCVF